MNESGGEKVAIYYLLIDRHGIILYVHRRWGFAGGALGLCGRTCNSVSTLNR
jgi:hypothetical protein